jgi:hypothetical protein
MMQGGCLCGAVRFELDRAVGPFELCHCNRCRKTTGSAYAAGLGVRVADFRWLEEATHDPSRKRADQVRHTLPEHLAWRAAGLLNPGLRLWAVISRLMWGCSARFGAFKPLQPATHIHLRLA